MELWTNLPAPENKNLAILRSALIEANLKHSGNVEQWMEKNVKEYYYLRKAELKRKNEQKEAETLKGAGFHIP